jgi:hypothetical protein
MRARLALLIAMALSPALAACGGATQPVASVSTKPVKPSAALVRPARPPATPPTARVQLLPGLDGVIGASAAELSRQFGPPRLDVLEGDVRKLQFTGTPCVLDVFLYPPAQGREPVATYVDARRQSDGRDVDRAACVAGLRKR